MLPGYRREVSFDFICRVFLQKYRDIERKNLFCCRVSEPLAFPGYVERENVV